MNVGIDASRAVSGAPTGTEYYSQALIDALLSLDSPFRFRLYTRSLPQPALFPATGNYSVRAIPFPRLWTHLRLSYEMLADPPDTLFVPAHVLPVIHPRRSVVTVHDLGYLLFPQAHPRVARLYLDLSTRWNARAARAIVADSHATRADLVRHYQVPPDKVRVVYPSYNSAVFKPAGEPERQRILAKYEIRPPYIIAVGTVHPRKNYARLIQAMARVDPQYSLVVVGRKGWMSASILEQAQVCGVAERVRFLDYVPIADLAPLYGGAVCSVFPSLYEGFGFPALEAQACEAPLVCSNAASLREVAGDGAEYFDPLEVDAMASAIARVLQDDRRRAGLVERGKRNLARFAWERCAREILEIIKSL